MPSQAFITMKKLILLLFTFSLTQLCLAQANTQFRDDTVKLIKMSGSAEALTDLVAQVGATVPEAKRMEFMKATSGILEDMYNDIAQIYMNEFTHEEIKQLISFYESDLGKKLASKQNTMMQKAMPLGEQWAMNLMQLADQYSD